MSDQLADTRILLRVSRCGSFSIAAREFGLTQSAVSRAVARLEGLVGLPLLTRTTRAVSLTDAGVAYLAKAEPALLALIEAEEAARGSHQLRGVLRVTLTSSIAVREIIPALPAFTQGHPELRLVILIADERRRLVEEGVDLAVRLGPIDDSAMVAKHVAQWDFRLYAAPAYVDLVGAPLVPDDLDRMVAIYHAECPTQRWTFKRGRSVVHRDIQPFHVVSSQEGCVAAAKAGLGYIYSAPPAVRGEVASGTLVPLLPDWTVGSLDMHLVFPAGRAATKAARAFADFVVAHFERSGLISSPA